MIFYFMLFLQWKHPQLMLLSLQLMGVETLESASQNSKLRFHFFNLGESRFRHQIDI